MTLADIVLAVSLFTVSIETPVEIQQGWIALGKIGRVTSYATWEINTQPPRNCIIHVPLLNGRTISYWLHEIKHCKKGQWHTSK